MVWLGFGEERTGKKAKTDMEVPLQRTSMGIIHKVRLSLSESESS